MIFDLVYLLATASVAFAAVLAVVDRSTHALLAIIVLFPVANIYVGGIAVFAALAVLCAGSAAANLTINKAAWFTGAWTFWLIWSLVGFLYSGFGVRGLFQAAEFMMYGLIGVVLTVLCIASTGLFRQILVACIASAAILGILCSAASMAGSEWPVTLPGRNESALYIVVFGVMPLTYFAMGPSQLPRAQLSLIAFFLAFMAFIVPVAQMQARGATAISLAMAGGVLAVRSSSRSVLRFTLVYAVIATAAGIYLWTSGMIVRLADTQVNFSNIERLGMLVASLRLFVENPILGYGWGSVDQIFPFIRETVLSYPHPHNTLARFAVEMGIGGILFLALIFGRLLYRAREFASRGLFAESAWLILVTIGLVGLSMIDVVFYGASRAIPFVFMLAFAEALPLNTHVFIPRHRVSFASESSAAATA